MFSNARGVGPFAEEYEMWEMLSQRSCGRPEGGWLKSFFVGSARGFLTPLKSSSWRVFFLP